MKWFKKFSAAKEKLMKNLKKKKKKSYLSNNPLVNLKKMKLNNE